MFTQKKLTLLLSSLTLLGLPTHTHTIDPLPAVAIGTCVVLAGVIGGACIHGSYRISTHTKAIKNIDDAAKGIELQYTSLPHGEKSSQTYLEKIFCDNKYTAPQARNEVDRWFSELDTHSKELDIHKKKLLEEHAWATQSGQASLINQIRQTLVLMNALDAKLYPFRQSKQQIIPFLKTAINTNDAEKRFSIFVCPTNEKKPTVFKQLVQKHYSHEHFPFITFNEELVTKTELIKDSVAALQASNNATTQAHEQQKKSELTLNALERMHEFLCTEPVVYALQNDQKQYREDALRKQKIELERREVQAKETSARAAQQLADEQTGLRIAQQQLVAEQARRNAELERRNNIAAAQVVADAANSLSHQQCRKIEHDLRNNNNHLRQQSQALTAQLQTLQQRLTTLERAAQPAVTNIRALLDNAWHLLTNPTFDPQLMGEYPAQERKQVMELIAKISQELQAVERQQGGR